MDQETKFALGKLMGEVYRMQKRMDDGVCPVDDQQIYGLLAGIETVIDEVFDDENVTKQQYDHAMDVLSEIDNDPDKLAAFKGFYDIENKLSNGGVTRSKAIKLFKLFNETQTFASVLRKINSSHSPIECKNCQIDRNRDC